MLTSLHRAAAAVDAQFTIHALNEKPVSILYLPQQATKHTFTSYAARARTRAASHTRAHTANLHEVDQHTWRDATKRRTDENYRILLNTATGAMWAAGPLYELGHSDNPECPHCHHEYQTADHLLWECQGKVIKEAREKAAYS